MDQGTMQAAPGKYLSFRVGDETYGLEILRVQEVIGLTSITRVPQVTEAVRGVINLRGRVIPVFDLRVAFSTFSEDTEVTCIVIAQVEYAESTVTVGFIADEIRGVIEVSEAEMGPVPEFGLAKQAPFLIGMATTESGLMMALDIDRVMGADDLAALESTS